MPLRKDSRQPYPPPLIGALLRSPWETVQARLLAGLHDRGFTDLGAPHLTVMQWPGPDGLKPSELARQARTSKQAMNYLLGQLERAGYIRREGDTEDQRSRRVRLTERGWALAEAMREIVGEVEREWEAELGRERFSDLRDTLRLLHAATTAPR